jgi:tetratricopeptide (TPR) repeat protein
MDAEISLPLHELFTVCISPGTVEPEILVDSCQRISRWAEEKGLPRTAIAYAYAAAVISPGATELAFRVGFLARKEADHARAEAWFRRAIGLARRSQDVRMQATTLISLGNLFVRRGDYQHAEMAHRKALRLARRHGLRELRGKALHDLCVVAFETGQFEKAERFAYHAYKVYRRGHPLLPVLAHDVAAFWLLQGKFQRALDTFQAAFSLMREQPQQLWILGNIAHAAGGAGRREDFTGAWVQAWRIIDSQPASGSTGPALLNLAYGAVHLEDWERVEMASSLAIATSIRRQETRVREEAEALIRAARGKSLASPGEEIIYPPRKGEIGDALASRLVEALDSMRG